MEAWDEEAAMAMEAEIEEIARQEAIEECPDEGTQGGEPDTEEGNPGESTGAAGITEEQKERMHRHRMEALGALSEEGARQGRPPDRARLQASAAAKPRNSCTFLPACIHFPHHVNPGLTPCQHPLQQCAFCMQLS